MSNKYRDYDIVIGEDFPRDCYYVENHLKTDLLRVHYRVTRLPSEKRFTLRHLQDATAVDRAHAEADLPRLRSMFAGWERIGAVRRGRYAGNRRCAVFIVMLGTAVEDPLVQLELELMIENTTQIAEAGGARCVR